MSYLMSENGIESRACSALSYLTAGFAGIIIFVILYFAKIRPSKFFRFNLFQSIFISFALTVLSLGYDIIYSIFIKIPLIQILMSGINFILNKPFLIGYSLFQAVVTLYMIYVVAFSLMGKYPVIYKISKLIDNSIE